MNKEIKEHRLFNLAKKCGDEYTYGQIIKAIENLLEEENQKLKETIKEIGKNLKFKNYNGTKSLIEDKYALKIIELVKQEKKQ